MHTELTADQKELQPKLAAANINPESFLATDYLNHYNEIVMLLEMIPDMPDIVEDTTDWAPKSYPQHFEDSGFQAKDLAIEAFHSAPDFIKTSFANTCDELDTLITSTIGGLMNLNVIERGLSAEAAELIRQRILNIQELLMKLNQVIHGKIDATEVETADLPEVTAAEPAEDVQSQEDIDKLFD